MMQPTVLMYSMRAEVNALIDQGAMRPRCPISLLNIDHLQRIINYDKQRHERLIFQ